MGAKAEETWQRNGRSVYRNLDEPAFILTVESEAIALENLLNALQQQLADLKAVFHRRVNTGPLYPGITHGEAQRHSLETRDECVVCRLLDDKPSPSPITPGEAQG